MKYSNYLVSLLLLVGNVQGYYPGLEEAIQTSDIDHVATFSAIKFAAQDKQKFIQLAQAQTNRAALFMPPHAQKIKYAISGTLAVLLGGILTTEALYFAKRKTSRFTFCHTAMGVPLLYAGVTELRKAFTSYAMIKKCNKALAVEALVNKFLTV